MQYFHAFIISIPNINNIAVNIKIIHVVQIMKNHKNNSQMISFQFREYPIQGFLRYSRNSHQRLFIICFAPK